MKQQKEKEIDPSFPKSVEPTLKKAEKMAVELIKKIQARLDSPVEKAADKAGQLTTFGELKFLLQNAAKGEAKIALNNIENVVLAGLALVPVLGQAEGGAIAAKELADAAILEGATAKQASALTKGAQVTAGTEVVYPLSKVIGVEGAKRLNKVLKAVDPYPELHPIIPLVAGGAELVGVHGAAAIPSAAQILVNEFKSVKLAAETAFQAGKIILKSPEVRRMKEFGASVLTSLGARLNGATSPRAALAAQAFR